MFAKQRTVFIETQAGRLSEMPQRHVKALIKK